MFGNCLDFYVNRNSLSCFTIATISPPVLSEIVISIWVTSLNA